MFKRKQVLRGHLAAANQQNVAESFAAAVAPTVVPAAEHPLEDQKTGAEQVKQQHNQAVEVDHPELVQAGLKRQNPHRIDNQDHPAALPQPPQAGGAVQPAKPERSDRYNRIDRAKKDGILRDIQRRAGAAGLDIRQEVEPQEVRKQIGGKQQQGVQHAAANRQDALVLFQHSRGPSLPVLNQRRLSL